MLYLRSLAWTVAKWRAIRLIVTLEVSIIFHQPDLKLTHDADIKPLVHPTIRQLTLIADAVERFDPERWRENHHPPQSPIEGRATKVKGMAEVIRNEIECMSNARYHTMSDDELVMLWGLKSMKGAQMVFL
jgi:hypothetical protein